MHIREDETPAHKSRPLRGREAAVKMCRGRPDDPDVLVVVDACVLGHNPQDILAVLAEVHDNSEGWAGVLELSTGKLVRFSPEARDVVEFAAKGGQDLRSRARSAGLQAARASGNTGRKKALQGPRLARAKAMWAAGGENGMSMTQKQVAAEFGVSVNTMHVYMGAAKPPVRWRQDHPDTSE